MFLTTVAVPVPYSELLLVCWLPPRVTMQSPPPNFHVVRMHSYLVIIGINNITPFLYMKPISALCTHRYGKRSKHSTHFPSHTYVTEQEMEIARAMTATFTKTPQKNIDNLKGSNPASVPHQLTQEEARAVSADSHLQRRTTGWQRMICNDSSHIWTSLFRLQINK